MIFCIMKQSKLCRKSPTAGPFSLLNALFVRLIEKINISGYKLTLIVSNCLGVLSLYVQFEFPNSLINLDEIRLVSSD